MTVKVNLPDVELYENGVRVLTEGYEPSQISYIGTGTGLTGGPINYQNPIGTISHLTTTGYKHIPSGGSSNQVLRWSADGTATWSAPHEVPTGGTANQVLAKNSATNYDLKWVDMSGGASLTTDDYLTSAEIQAIIGSATVWDGTVE